MKTLLLLVATLLVTGNNPHFPALRSGPTAASGAYPKSEFLAAIDENSSAL